jgi:cell division septation protein DedD
MRGVFDDEELEPAQPRRETELTLGPIMLLGIFFGLVLICGLFFGLGYAMGHHGSREPSAAMQPARDAQTSLQADGSRPKPSPTSPTGVATLPQDAVVEQAGDQAPSEASDTNAAASSQSAEPATADGSVLSQPQIRPALPPAANPPQPAAGPVGGLNVQPAIAPALPLMVQIAAVSHPEDAEVLVNALLKRGYTVTARREAADSLIHVRIGPFSSRDEANRWRQKLLNDGYNAIIQP